MLYKRLPNVIQKVTKSTKGYQMYKRLPNVVQKVTKCYTKGCQKKEQGEGEEREPATLCAVLNPCMQSALLAIFQLRPLIQFLKEKNRAQCIHRRTQSVHPVSTACHLSIASSHSILKREKNVHNAYTDIIARCYVQALVSKNVHVCLCA